MQIGTRNEELLRLQGLGQIMLLFATGVYLNAAKDSFTYTLESTGLLI